MSVDLLQEVLDILQAEGYEHHMRTVVYKQEEKDTEKK